MVPPLDAQVRRHVSRFDVIALVLYRDGRIGTSRDPQNAEFAFWLEAQHAGAVLRLARVKGDIPAAAQRLGLKVTDHHTMIVRARAAVERLDQGLARAKADGALRFSTPNISVGGLPRARPVKAS